MLAKQSPKFKAARRLERRPSCAEATCAKDSNETRSNYELLATVEKPSSDANVSPPRYRISKRPGSFVWNSLGPANADTTKKKAAHSDEQHNDSDEKHFDAEKKRTSSNGIPLSHVQAQKPNKVTFVWHSLEPSSGRTKKRKADHADEQHIDSDEEHFEADTKKHKKKHTTRHMSHGMPLSHVQKEKQQHGQGTTGRTNAPRKQWYTLPSRKTDSDDLYRVDIARLCENLRTFERSADNGMGYLNKEQIANAIRIGQDVFYLIRYTPEKVPPQPFALDVPGANFVAIVLAQIVYSLGPDGWKSACPDLWSTEQMESLMLRKQGDSFTSDYVDDVEVTSGEQKTRKVRCYGLGTLQLQLKKRRTLHLIMEAAQCDVEMPRAILDGTLPGDLVPEPVRKDGKSVSPCSYLSVPHALEKMPGIKAKLGKDWRVWPRIDAGRIAAWGFPSQTFFLKMCILHDIDTGDFRKYNMRSGMSYLAEVACRHQQRCERQEHDMGDSNHHVPS